MNYSKIRKIVKNSNRFNWFFFTVWFFQLFFSSFRSLINFLSFLLTFRVLRDRIC
jgi:hypothetical protein